MAPWPHGPNAYEAQWLAWFAAAANPQFFDDDFRKIAAYLANREKAKHFPDVAPDFRAVLSGSGDYLLSPRASRHDRRPIPKIVKSDCYYPNEFVMTTSLNEITNGSVLDSIRSQCGACNTWSVTQFFEGQNQSQNYDAIDYHCGIGPGGVLVSGNPFTILHGPSAGDSSNSDSSGCVWSTNPSYSAGYGYTTYFEYLPIGSCQYSKKKVTIENEQESIVYQ